MGTLNQGDHLPPDAARRAFFELTLQFDDPAFVRRARSVEQALRDLIRTVERRQEELLEVACTRLAIVAALVDGDWTRLTAVLSEADAVGRLHGWYELWRPQLKGEVTVTKSKARWRRAIRELNVSLEYFNRHWAAFLGELDLSRLNRLREDYNRYYVIEKSCAFQSESMGRMDFTPLSPLTLDQLREQYPLLKPLLLKTNG